MSFTGGPTQYSCVQTARACLLSSSGRDCASSCRGVLLFSLFLSGTSPCYCVAIQKVVLVLPYEDLVVETGFDPTWTRELFDAYQKPYFTGTFCTLHHSDSFQVDGPHNRVVVVVVSNRPGVIKLVLRRPSRFDRKLNRASIWSRADSRFSRLRQVTCSWGQTLGWISWRTGREPRVCERPPAAAVHGDCDALHLGPNGDDCL